MNYQETVEYLLTRLPMFSRIGAAAYKEDLGNTIALCDFLDNPHRKFKSVHIAGTNGKGSVSHMLAAIFQTAGYKTGLYTSPHLKDFRERIKIDGKMIDEEFVVRFTEKIRPLSERIEPSFFELTVAMAFDYFATEKVDIAIIETGLGGRLDSTNIITPEISVITNIGMDHMHLLGDTLPKIAGEKAGIIKPKIPVVIGEVLPDTLPVFTAKAAKENAPVTVASHRRQATTWTWEKHEMIVEVAQEHREDRSLFHLDLPGIYQRKNLLTVLEACSVLHGIGWNIDESKIKKALRHVKQLTGLHGRWDILHSKPTIVLDVAHNEDGIQQLTKQIEITDHNELHLVLGFVKDKEVEKILGILPKSARYYFTQAQIPRAMPAAELATRAQAHGLQGMVYLDVNNALSEAKSNAGPDDLIVVCGSVFLVGEVQF